MRAILLFVIFTTSVVVADDAYSNQCKSAKLAVDDLKNLSLQDLHFYGLILESESLGCRDLKNAKLLYEYAALRMYAPAQYQLCRFEEFQGHDQIAVKWCYVASKQGYHQASERLENMRKLIYKKVFTAGIEDGVKLEKAMRVN